MSDFICYIDILGYKTAVEDGKSKFIFERSQDLIFSIRNSIKKINKATNVIIKSLAFSDNILFWIDIETKNKDMFLSCLCVFLREISHIQKSFLKEKILLRGSITSGEIIFDEENLIVGGAGLVKAVELEANADIPNIIIDFPKNTPQFEIEKNGYNDYYIIHKETKNYYSNFLSDFDYRIGKDGFHDLDESRKSIINLLEDYQIVQDNVKQKYEWLLKYYNEICDFLNKAYKKIDIQLIK